MGFLQTDKSTIHAGWFPFSASLTVDQDIASHSLLPTCVPPGVRSAKTLHSPHGFTASATIPLTKSSGCTDTRAQSPTTAQLHPGFPGILKHLLFCMCVHGGGAQVPQYAGGGLNWFYYVYSVYSCVFWRSRSGSSCVAAGTPTYSIISLALVIFDNLTIKHHYLLNKHFPPAGI